MLVDRSKREEPLVARLPKHSRRIESEERGESSTMDRRIKRKLEILIISITIVISHNYFDTAVLAYSKPNQVKSDITDSSLNIYNIPLKKVHVGDIDVAYKILGKGNNTVILINGAGESMNFWDQC